MHGNAVIMPVADRLARVPGADLGDWMSVATLGLGAFAIGTDMFVVAGVLGGLAGDLGVTVGAAGLTVTGFALAYAIGAPLLSALLGARRLRSVLIGSVVLFGLFNVTSAVAPSLGVLLGARVLSALAASVYVPAAGAAVVPAVSESQRGRALAVILGGSSIAMVLGAPLGVLLAATYSWRVAFGLVAVLAAVTALGLRRSSVGSVPLMPSTMGQRLRLLRSPAVAGLLGVTLLVMTGSNSMYTYLDVLLGSAAGPAGLGLLIGVFGVGGMIGTWWGGATADRWGGRPVVLLAASVLTAGFALLPFVASTLAGTLVVVALWGIAAWGFVPAQQHRLIEFGPQAVPLLLGLNSSAIHLGFAAGALLGGQVVDATGAGPLWMLAVTCCGAGLILHALLTRRSRS
ncbi:MAG TPA: MFS transporter [Pseudonocardiaceae bacterium]